MDTTKKVAEYVYSKGINLAALARNTGIPYQTLFESLSPKGRNRKIKADELLKICTVLEVNPMDFA